MIKHEFVCGLMTPGPEYLDGPVPGNIDHHQGRVVIVKTLSFLSCVFLCVFLQPWARLPYIRAALAVALYAQGMSAEAVNNNWMEARLGGWQGPAGVFKQGTTRRGRPLGSPLRALENLKQN